MTDRNGIQPDGRKGILVRVAPDDWRKLRALSARLTVQTGRSVTMQSLTEQAIKDMVRFEQ